MLTQAIRVEELQRQLLPRERWHPLPKADEREFWETLPATVREAHIGDAAAASGCAWPSLPAALFLEFARNGNRNRYEKQCFARRNTLCGLVLAECMEGRERFVDDIVNGMWAICEESFWGVPAHIGMQKAGRGLPDVEDPVVPLFVGQTAGLLAWTLYLLGPQLDSVSPLIRRRLHLEMDRRVLTPCLERDDFWWMGFAGRRVNNWNPWLNSNWLTAALLMETDQERRLAAVHKSMRSLDRFIDDYPADGGCDEGPGYWGHAGASLFDCLELLRSATGGALDLYEEPLIRKIGQYIYKVQICGDYFINFADASARITPPASVVFQYGKRIGDAHMTSLGAWIAKDQQLATGGLTRHMRIGSLGRLLGTLTTLEEILASEPVQPLPRDVWLPDIQVMAARDRQGVPEGLYVAAKGGHNAESHNHNDVGSVIVYTDGKPLIVDVGVETYTAKTFSPHRYDIWTMQSAFHNLPTINGAMQQPGEEYCARGVNYSADEDSARLALDIAGAYSPEAGLIAWQRTIELVRGRHVEIEDEYELARPAADIALNLLTPCDVRTDTPGTVRLNASVLAENRPSGAGRLTYDADTLSATVEDIPLEDDRLRNIWGERLRRIVLTARAPGTKGRWTVRIAQ